MIKVIAYIHRNPKLTHEEFRAYWTNVHVPLIKSKLPGLRRYAGCFPVPVDDGRRLQADAIVELGFDDLETLTAEMNAAEFLTPDRQASSAHLLDLSLGHSVVVEEVEVM